VAIFAMILAALFGIILGFPTLQLRGDYLAIVTLGFGEIIRIFMNNLDRPLNLTNGPKGITAIDSIQLFGINFAKTSDLGFIKMPGLYLVFYLFALLAIGVAIVCLHLQDSRIGRAWVAIREDEIAAKAMGINTRNMKLMAFAIGASFAGVAGVLFSAFQGFVSPESFTLWESIVVLAMVVLGGIGHIPGVILGAILLAVFPEVLRGVAEPVQNFLFGHVLVDVEVIRQLIYGLALILVMLYRPGGIWQKRSAS
jgi:branched-chain amino acid transport system permease protein